MARTVTDAAILLGALERSTPDINDTASRACSAPPGHDYQPFLQRDALRGARIGIPRAFFFDRLSLPGDSNPRGGLNAEQTQWMTGVIESLRRAGAEIVDPADILNPTPPWPDGFEPPKAPFGVSFAGGACSEPRLVGLAAWPMRSSS